MKKLILLVSFLLLTLTCCNRFTIDNLDTIDDNSSESITVETVSPPTTESINVNIDNPIATEKDKTANSINKTSEEISSSKYGCYPGNIPNKSVAVIYGEYNYYSHSTEIHNFTEGSLYKTKQDCSQTIKLSDDSPIYINAYDNWIYYSNMSDHASWIGGKIYKIRTDGTDRTKLNDVDSAYVNIVDDWIYYVDITTGDYRHNLYKMKLDGTGVTKLNDQMSSHLTVIDNWIYFLGWELDEEKHIYKKYIYKMLTDGTQKTKITDECADMICTDGKLLLFNNMDDEGKLYCINLQNGEKIKLTDMAAKFANLYENFIYCIMGNDRIYRMNLDGSNQTIIYDDFSYAINIVGDWIYFYHNPGEGLEGRKMKLDGTMETEF